MHLAGTHFSDFFKINILLGLGIFENVENFNIRVYQFLAKIRQIANFAQFSTRKWKSVLKVPPIKNLHNNIICLTIILGA